MISQLVEQEAVTSTAIHFQHLLDGIGKEVAGSTYREVKGLLQRIIQNGYLDWKPQPEQPEPIQESEPTESAPEVVNNQLENVKSLTLSVVFVHFN